LFTVDIHSIPDSNFYPRPPQVADQNLFQRPASVVMNKDRLHAMASVQMLFETDPITVKRHMAVAAYFHEQAVVGQVKVRAVLMAGQKNERFVAIAQAVILKKRHTLFFIAGPYGKTGLGRNRCRPVTKTGSPAAPKGQRPSVFRLPFSYTHV